MRAKIPMCISTDLSFYNQWIIKQMTTMVSKNQICVGQRFEQAIEEIFERTTCMVCVVLTKVIGSGSIVEVKTKGSVDNKVVCRAVAVVAVSRDDVLGVIAVVFVVLGWVIVVSVVDWVIVVVVVGWDFVAVVGWIVFIVVGWIVVVIVVYWIVFIVMVGSLSKGSKRILFVFYVVTTFHELHTSHQVMPEPIIIGN